MSILVDFNHLTLASLFMSVGNHTNVDIDVGTVRHMALNSIRANRQKFYGDFGEIVICADGRRSWRKDAFPYYKANRKKVREETDLDWQKTFEAIDTIYEELVEFFPYKTLRFDDCEADDIIGTICQYEGRLLTDGSNDQNLILSGDKDFIQLHRFANVKQYAPVMKKFIEHSDPEQYLKEHILKGDRGDGIPNVLSPDNCISVGERQKSLRKKLMEEALEKWTDHDDADIARRIERNRQLIDLGQIPQHLQDKILAKYSEEKEFGRTKLRKYFIEKRLTNLFKDLPEF